MNPMHQLTRRPVKAAFGALLLALAGVILALSGGQFWAAARTRARVEATYTTVAVVTGGDEPAGDSDPSLASASAAWEAARFLAEPEQQNWSIIRSRPRVGLVSGYASNLMPLLDMYNFRSYNGGETMDSAPDAPYTYFILEVLVTDALERHDRPQEGASYSESTWSISGQVQGVYGLQQRLRDPTGWQADIRFTQYYGDGDVPVRPEAGKRYLLLACTYDDTEWEERCGIAAEILWDTNVRLDPWSLDIENNLIRYDQRTRQEEQVLDETLRELPPDAPGYRDPTTGAEVFNLSMNAADHLRTNVVRYSGPLETLAPDGDSGLWTMQTVDYGRYDLPSIQELPEGVTAREIMDGTASWQTALKAVDVNNHSVPVLTVEKVEALADFAAGNAMVTQGRSFFQSEYDSGAAVCLISESLARKNGLNVGDSLPLSLYEDDPGLPPIYARFQESCNPRASVFVPQEGFRQETEYTIIGLYRQSSEWVTTPTSFTPNSVFAPEKSVTCRTVTGSCGVWSSLILQNGTIDQMESRLAENGLGGTVTYYDQGYSDIVESLDGYTRVSRTVLCVGLALWAVILAAYCVLLPMQEGKTALRMWTLGAKRRDIAGQIWTPSALMAAAGTVIALAVSIPGMSWATDKIQALTGSDLTLTVSTGQTVALCAGALAIALAVIALVSVSTAQRGIRKAE
ncbi:MAG: hypothetical protein ACLUIC_09550 [Oscillospiraceae bacterium]